MNYYLYKYNYKLVVCMVLRIFNRILFLAGATFVQILLIFIFSNMGNKFSKFVYLDEPIFELPSLTIKLSPCGAWSPR